MTQAVLALAVPGPIILLIVGIHIMLTCYTVELSMACADPYCWSRPGAAANGREISCIWSIAQCILRSHIGTEMHAHGRNLLVLLHF